MIFKGLNFIFKHLKRKGKNKMWKAYVENLSSLGGPMGSSMSTPIIGDYNNENGDQTKEQN